MADWVAPASKSLVHTMVHLDRDPAVVPQALTVGVMLHVAALPEIRISFH
jgi:hypothetical protein